MEALPVLVKALDDDSVVFSAIKCIGKLGPQVLVGDSSDTSQGLAARLLSLGDKVWDYSDYKML